MKVIKKYFKLVMCFMAFALCSFLMVFAPTMTAISAEAALTNYTKKINSVKMPKQVDAEEKDLVIPFLKDTQTTFAKDGYSIKVVDPAGYAHTCKIVYGTDGKEKFATETYMDGATEKTLILNGNAYFETVSGEGVKVSALTNGNYQVVYIVNEDGKDFYSNIYNVNVINVSYEISLAKENGLINLVKPEVGVSSEVEDRIEIPTAYAQVVGDEDADKVEIDFEREVTVSYNGTNINAAATGSDFVKVNVGTSADPEYKYYIQPSKPGVYKVQYTYKRGVNRPTKTITIKASNNFEKPTEFKVSTVPSFDKFELGQKGITLPKLTAKNEYQDNVEYNVESIKIQKTTDSNIQQTLFNNNYTFDMTLEAFHLNAETDSYSKLEGKYEIIYTLVDAYGNKDEYKKPIENVTVSSNPTIKMVYDYTATGTMLEGNFVTTANPEKADTQLHNKYGYDEIVLPAVYAEDLVSRSNELIVVRYLRNVNTSKVYCVDNVKYNDQTGALEEIESTDTVYGYNYSDDANLGNVNKAVTFRFADGEKGKDFAGTYQLEYKVYAKNVKKRNATLAVSGSTKYTFTVLALSKTAREETTPNVEITNVVNKVSVDRNDLLNVNLTAKDDHDSRLKNVVYYYYGDEVAGIDTKITDWLNVGTNSESKEQHVLDKTTLLNYLRDEKGFTGLTAAKLNEAKTGFVVDFNKLSGVETVDNAIKAATKAVVVAISYNDYGKIDIDTRTINFKNTTEEDEPEVTIDSWGDFDSTTNTLKTEKAKIGETITLPELTYKDAVDSTLSIDVSYYIDSPYNDETGLSYLSPNTNGFKNLYNPEHTVYLGTKVSGGTIDIEQGGNYVVVYTATDDAGNTNVTYFTFNIASVVKPVLSVNPTGEDITISGNTVTAEVGSEIAFDTILRAGASNNIVTGVVDVEVENNGLKYSLSGDREMAYIFKNIGTYTLKFTGSYDGQSAVEKVIYVNITKKQLKWLNEFDVPEYAEKDSYVYLPDIAASDNAVVSVTVTPINGTELKEEDKAVKVSKDEDGNPGSFWRFKTGTSEGNYTVKYTATTPDATLEKTFTIKVGDNVPPTIEFEHKAELQKDIVYDGSNQIEIKFDVKKTGAVEDRYFKIIATSNGQTIYSYDLGLNITDVVDGSVAERPLFWSDLKYEVTGDSSVLKKDSDNLYLISGTGTFTIKLSVEDANGNPTVENIVFKVVSDSKVEEENDTVVGVVLIVISLVVLAGVILYFMLTGKKGKGKKTNKVVKQARAKTNKLQAKNVEAKEEVEEAKVEETEVPETTETAETEETTENNDAKEGEIEE